MFTVLHLGNVYFHRKQLKHGQEGVEIGSDAEIRWTGHLLQLSVDGIKQALTTKTTVTTQYYKKYHGYSILHGIKKCNDYNRDLIVVLTLSN